MKLADVTPTTPVGTINRVARIGCAILGLAIFGGAIFLAPLPTVQGQSSEQANSSHATPVTRKGKIVILEELPPQERARLERELGISVPDLLAAAETINQSNLSLQGHDLQSGDVLRKLDDADVQASIDAAFRAVDGDRVSAALKQTEMLDDPSVRRSLENLPQTLAVINQVL